MSLEVELAKEFVLKIDNKTDSNTALIYELNENIKALDERLRKIEDYVSKKQSTIAGFVPDRGENEECNDDIVAGR